MYSSPINVRAAAGGSTSFRSWGRGDFASVEYTFEQTVDRNATNDEAREAVNTAIRLGLVPYVAQAQSISGFSLDYSRENQEASGAQTPDDKWRHWIFTAYVGDIELEKESNRTVFDSRWGFFADHVSEQWKLRLRPYFNYDLVKIKRDDQPDVRSSISRHGFDSYAIRSLGPHWSVGVFGDYVTRNDRNIRRRFEVAPGIEYSVLPYEQATRRAITVVYRLGLARVDYFERTIFDQTKETLLQQELEASVAIRQPWGDIYGGHRRLSLFPRRDQAQRRVLRGRFGAAAGRVVAPHTGGFRNDPGPVGAPGRRRLAARNSAATTRTGDGF